MTFYELEIHKQIEHRFGELGNNLQLVIFEKYRELLEKIFELLIHPSMKLSCSTEDELMYISAEERSPLKIRLSRDELSALNQLLSVPRVKIGKIGEYDIFFDINAQQKFIVDYGKSVLNDPLELNAVIYSQYQTAFALLEEWGSINEAIINKNTQDLTLFLDDGSEQIIKQTHSSYIELNRILSGELIEVGVVMSDELRYSKSVGYFNGKTGKPYGLKPDIQSSIDSIAQESIEMYAGQVKIIGSGKEKDEQAQIHIMENGEDITIEPKDPRNHFLQQLNANESIMAGRCAGNLIVYFSLSTGPLMKTEFRRDLSVYKELLTTSAICKEVPQHSHLYSNTEEPSTLYIITPLERNRKVKMITSSSELFPALIRLLRGDVGVFQQPEGEDVAYTVVYNPDSGIIYDKQSAKEVFAALEALNSSYFNFDFNSVTDSFANTGKLSKGQQKKAHKREKRAVDNSKIKKLTRKEKRLQETLSLAVR